MNRASVHSVALKGAPGKLVSVRRTHKKELLMKMVSVHRAGNSLIFSWKISICSVETIQKKVFLELRKEEHIFSKKVSGRVWPGNSAFIKV